jgi:hypothetical protein
VRRSPNIEIDDGFFPTGVVYDRLGTVVFAGRRQHPSWVQVSVAP